ncbi:MAG: DNA adenine methylase [Desulfurellales bacterium]|nr:MAG: DNA adenine methylase [Desulfurellales bacterium]
MANEFVGSCIVRRGGKRWVAPKIIPHFAKAELYLEPFFGGGSVYYALPTGLYERYAVNDLDKSIYTFFSVLRDRTEELIAACELSPFSKDEFAACLEKSEDPLEEARRVWVRTRQGFNGTATHVGNWGRGDGTNWPPKRAEGKLRQLREYAAALRTTAFDNCDAIEFIPHWDRGHSFIYCDPPYVPETRRSDMYEHEMTAEQHRRLADELRKAVAKGSRVAISGYASELYDRELYADWRRVEYDVAFSGQMKKTGEERRTEVLWMSYPETEEIGATWKPAPKATSAREKALLGALQRSGKVGRR